MDREHSALRSAAVLTLCGLFAVLAVGLALLSSGAYLYCLDGQLMELYAESGSGLEPADGLAVLPLEDLSVETDGAVITFAVIAPDGVVSTASVSPWCGFEEVGEL